MDSRPALGRAGEDAAADLYRRQGFKVRDRNYRCSLGEIDIIAQSGRLLVFCEVKTRATDRWGLPAEAVNVRKRARIRRLAGSWMHDHRTAAGEIRFDVVSVLVANGRLEVTHFPHAF
ncbi:MAG: YraN family protein [Actinobacteria bacterium]|nr:YraN family protein [Actinomycetota bacterium]